MSASQPGYFNLQELTDAGALAIGGRVYTYAAGTTTFKAAYVEPTGTTPFTYTSDGIGGMYIALNARGELPAPLYLATGSYDVALKTAAGATVWTRRADPTADVGAAISANLADTSDTAKGDALVGVKRHGAGATAQTLDSWIESHAVVSIVDYGGTEGLVADNTTAFNACLAALGDNGGVIEFPMGNWRGNFLVNQHNITLAGRGGVGELNTLPCLRPYATGSSTYTVKVSNQTRANRKCGLRDIAISGDNGSGVMADAALFLGGGTVDFYAHNFDLMDGLHSLHIEPGGTYPVTGVQLSQFKIRNDYGILTSRAIYVRRYADATGYVTALNFNQGHVNKTGLGYWMELDGTGSVGLTVGFGQTYVDHAAGYGIYMHGTEFIECQGGLQLDPGAANTEVIFRNDLVKDPSRTYGGTLLGIGGQKMVFSDLSFITFSTQPGLVSYEPLLRRQYAIGPVFWSNATDPYSEAVQEDMTGAAGFKVLTGAAGEGIQTDNGARWVIGQLSELIVLNTGAAFTVAAVNQLPANSIIESVVGRVIAAIGTAASWSLGDAVTPARFGTSSAMSAGSTLVGLTHCDQTGAAGPKQVTAATPRITLNTAPSSGSIRVTIFYRQMIGPTS